MKFFKSTTNVKPVFIRWMIMRDLSEVLRIEYEEFQHAWTEEEFFDYLRVRNHIGMVAETNEKVVGYYLYALHSDHLTLKSIAVCHKMQRRGIGRRMIENLQAKLSPERRNRITLKVSERNTDAHLFFKAMGFKAVHVIPDYFTPSADAYVFRCRTADLECFGR